MVMVLVVIAVMIGYQIIDEFGKQVNGITENIE